MIISSILTIVFIATADAQKITIADSSFKTNDSPHINLSDTVISKPEVKYIYRQPTNELMRWPNFPATADEVNRNMDKAAEKNKVLPNVLKTILSKKNKIKGTTSPKF